MEVTSSSQIATWNFLFSAPGVSGWRTAFANGSKKRHFVTKRNKIVTFDGAAVISNLFETFRNRKRLKILTS
jgi:hypothetical protein